MSIVLHVMCTSHSIQSINTRKWLIGGAMQLTTRTVVYFSYCAQFALVHNSESLRLSNVSETEYQLRCSHAIEAISNELCFHCTHFIRVQCTLH